MKNKLFAAAVTLVTYILLVLGFGFADAQQVSQSLSKVGLSTSKVNETESGASSVSNLIDPMPRPPKSSLIDPMPRPPKSANTLIDPMPRPPKSINTLIDPMPRPPKAK